MRGTVIESVCTEFYPNGICELSGFAKHALDQEFASLPEGEVSEQDTRYPADHHQMRQLHSRGLH
jgi:hypothetical protein